MPKKIKFRSELFIGIAAGIIITIVFYYIIQSRRNIKDSNYAIQSKNKTDTIKGDSYSFEIKQKNEIQVREYNAIIDEKLKSINERTSDFYLELI